MAESRSPMSKPTTESVLSPPTCSAQWRGFSHPLRVDRQSAGLSARRTTESSLTKNPMSTSADSAARASGAFRWPGLLGWLARFPRLAQTVKRLVVQWGVPFNRHVGVKVIVAAPDSSRVVLHLPLRHRNLNLAGTVHGAALFALAETVHGVAVLWQFPPSRYRMFTKTAHIEFLAKARGDLYVTFGLPEPTRREIEAALQTRGRAEVTLQASVDSSDGHAVAMLCATYVVWRHDAGPPPSAPVGQAVSQPTNRPRGNRPMGGKLPR